MNLYYFHIRNGHTVLDGEGSPLADLEAAKSEALKASSEMLRSAQIWAGTPWRLWVTDGPNATGNTLFALEFAATLP